MKNLFCFIALSWLAFQIGLAQPVMKKKPSRLIAASDQVFMNAEWSPSGEQIAFTSARHQGLFISKANGRQIKQITDDAGAGFSFAWSSDNQSILARPLVIEEGKRYHQVAVYEINGAGKRVLVNNTRGLKSMPQWVDGDACVAYVTNHGIRRVQSGKPALKGQTNSKLALLNENVVIAAVDLNLNEPKFEGRYVFNLKHSPDGRKIVFQVNGLGLYVINTDGTGLMHLGHGEQASWMPDSKFVLVTKVKDNGKVLTSGVIEAIDVTTAQVYPLLIDDQFIALNPSVSPDGKKVLIDNVKDGAIYMFELK